MNIVNQLTVAENLTLGRESNRFGVLKSNPQERSFSMLREFAPDVPLNRPVSRLCFAEKQLLEIVKAVQHGREAGHYGRADSGAVQARIRAAL